MKRTGYFGNSWIGLFTRSNRTHTFVPIDTTDKMIATIEENLKTEVIKTLIGGSNLVGLYMAMNSNGAILPNIASDEEIALVKKTGINVYRSHEKHNAHGNNLLVNDKGGLVNHEISQPERNRMEDVLGIKLLDGSIAKYNTVGSCAIATNKGFIAHFATSEAEIELLRNTFGVNGSKGSINTGTGFIQLGAVANDKGYVVGEQTSAFEMGRIEEALGFI